jgi:hypothetical protein
VPSRAPLEAVEVPSRAPLEVPSRAPLVEVPSRAPLEAFEAKSKFRPFGWPGPDALSDNADCLVFDDAAQRWNDLVSFRTSRFF